MDEPGDAGGSAEPVSEAWARAQAVLKDPAHAEELADLLADEGEEPLTDAGVEAGSAYLVKCRREARLRVLMRAHETRELNEYEQMEHRLLQRVLKQ